MANKQKCACGRELHYTDKANQLMVQKLVDQLGENVKVIYTGNGKTYLVQRHFIALHGLKGADLPKLGFKEIV